MFGYPNQPIILDDSGAGGGFTKKDLKTAADTAARKTREKADAEWREILDGWKEYATMLRIQKVAREDAVDELVNQGKIDTDEFYQLVKQFGEKIAKQEGFDLEKAREKFYKKK